MVVTVQELQNTWCGLETIRPLIREQEQPEHESAIADIFQRKEVEEKAYEEEGVVVGRTIPARAG